MPDSLPAKEQLLNVHIWRGSGEEGHYQTFQVPMQESQTILDVVSYIQQYIDAGLTYRFACSGRDVRVMCDDGQWRTALDVSDSCEKNHRWDEPWRWPDYQPFA